MSIGKHVQIGKVVELFLVLALCAVLPACVPLSIDGLLEQAYQDAIEDAKEVDADEISKDLLSITSDNELLEWEGEPGESRVKLVTWTSWDGFKDYLGQGTFSAARYMWMVVPNEVKGFIGARRYLNDEALALRLEQVYGLPPHYGLLYFVEVWVDPQDVFRPSPDPEITDHESEVDFPQSDAVVSLDPDFVEWFNNEKSGKYGEDGYPWTRLGYTYDWCPLARDEVGLSEFVITVGSEVEVVGIWETAQYGQ